MSTDGILFVCFVGISVNNATGMSDVTVIAVNEVS